MISKASFSVARLRAAVTCSARVVLAAACLANAVAAQEAPVDPPIRSAYEEAAAHLFGLTLSPSAIVSACARLYPEFKKENEVALEAWESRQAQAIALVRQHARQVLLDRSEGNASQVEAILQKHAVDAQRGAQERLERETQSKARQTCQRFPLALERGPFVLDTNPEVSILRSYDESVQAR